MSNDLWGRFDRQSTLRVELDARPEGWPVWIVAGLGAGFAGYEEDDRDCLLWICVDNTTNLNGETYDAYLGAKHYFQLFDGAIQPYAALTGGAAHGRLDAYLGDGKKEGDDLTTFGAGLQLGALMPLDDSGYALGLETRAFRGSGGSVFGVAMDNDFVDVTLFVAATW